ncbi:transcriptional regulator [Brevibacillus choshinensis]|uniref:helix-turn-helix transcriptional regulator n=1 Tax=Brevibacillus choshinensis TaxID=54911 RepID=UPI002E1DF36F|nr:PAS domain-containing protein [Brevibacillus choshinensis]MED4751911.1 PAS domain-containing protein [Brevibacillus choshinensis]MED4784342.1 PAS domain-containing protein [Brevibacillus choshinensis]
MKKTHPILASYIPVVEGLARTFGEHCEVVLHDLTDDISSSIIAIHNGHVSGRQIGSPVTNLALQSLRSAKVSEQAFDLNYRNDTIRGKQIKSSSIYIKDEQGEVIGSLCINLDMTHLSMAQAVIGSMIAIQDKRDEEKAEESFAPNVGVLMEQMIDDCLKRTVKPIALMQKEDKIQFIHQLDEMGLFLIKGAVQHVADLLDVSKFTIYNYLDKKTPQ